MTPAEINEKKNQFDKCVKERIMRGEAPERAVPDAAKECGITLAPEMIANIVQVLKFTQAQALNPEFNRQRRILNERLRLLVRGGMTISKAVVQAQDDTGVKLGEQGTKLLIQALEQESERMRGTMVEVVSADEFTRMQGQKCMFFHLNGKDGWQCCQCSTHNRKNQDACMMCSHGRCYVS